MNSNTWKTFAQPAGKAMIAVMVVAALVFAAGCGGGASSASSPNPTPTPGTAAANNAQVRFGDAPADSVISFEVTVSALTLTPSGGGTAVSIPVGANNRIELSHASGKFEPFALGNLPQGSFTAANLTLTNAELTFLSSTGTPVHINGPASSQITVPLSPAITIGTSPMVLSIDVNLANSVTLAGGVVNGIAFGPTSFTITAKAPGAQANQQDDDGEIEDIRGTVTSATANSFVLSVGQTKSSLTFNFDSTTQFSDGVTAATLANQIVKVEGFTKADGSLFAKEVEGLESNAGSEVEGLITVISGSTLTISADDGIGNGMDDTKVGASFSVNIAGLNASKFRVDGGNGFGGSVPNSLSFGPTTIHQGQRVEIESDVAVPPASGSITPDKIKLQQQGVSGTAANVSANSFDLNLAADSHLRIISGQTVVHVTKSAATDVRTTPTNGAVVRVRGLLFWDGTAWQMIARRVR
jgi:hypothetical protein